MKTVAGRCSLGRAAVLSAGVALFAFSLPALAQESSPDVASMPIGTVFRWLNFLLVFGALAYLIAKFGAPYFRVRARAIGKAIEEANQTRAVVERELRLRTEIESER